MIRVCCPSYLGSGNRQTGRVGALAGLQSFSSAEDPLVLCTLLLCQFHCPIFSNGLASLHLPLYVVVSRACNCSSAGSVNASCHVTTGQCACKRHVTGLKCDSCVDGTFNLATTSVDGCQKCFCFGRADTCTSAAGFIQAFIHSSRSMSRYVDNFHCKIVLLESSDPLDGSCLRLSNLQPVSQTPVRWETTDTGLVHRVMCLFTMQPLTKLYCLVTETHGCK